MKENFKDEIIFWEKAANSFHDYSDSPTTKYYLEQEMDAIKDGFDLKNKGKILKIDLWNEALNTGILFKLAELGMECFGIDLSENIVRRAKNKSIDKGLDLNLFVANLFHLPFSDNTFDYIYSMGTIEHSENYKESFSEMSRVLKNNGRILVGVPNLFDPFFHPLLVKILKLFSIFPFGIEKYFTITELVDIVSKNGFHVIKTGSLQFLPSMLRMADIFLFSYCKPISKISGILYKPFEFLKMNFKYFKGAGYLIYVIAEKRK
ncbi:MAG: class I SAM-dependent methyltransferase [bacterium]|nr:class I SAM-dependent methyltransferase [bacterium]